MLCIGIENLCDNCSQNWEQILTYLHFNSSGIERLVVVRACVGLHFFMSPIVHEL